VAAKPVAAKPVAAKPVAAKPVAAKPVAVVKPFAEKPVVKSAAPVKAIEAKASPIAAKPAPKPIAVARPVIEKSFAVAKLEVKSVSAPKVVKMTKDTGSTIGSASGKHRTPVVASYTCPYDPEELSQWRKLLLERRREISADIGALEKDAMEAEDGHTTPLHAAERGSDADLQDVSLGLAGEEKDLLWQIDRALRKIDLKLPLPFGLCEHNKTTISKPRLQLIPWTPLSIEGATHMEENHMMVEDLLMDD